MVVARVSMYRAFLLFAFALFFSINSYAVAMAEKPPEWLQQKISSGGKVSELTADGKKFYIIVSPCCDQFNPVFDEDGKQVCSTGGFTGKGDGKCPKFDMKK